MTAKILLLGDLDLRIISTKIENLNDETFIKNKAVLLQTLKEFRLKNGFGRGIAAPQIGVFQRFIALNLDNNPFVMVNPEITWKSEDTVEIWDDCMCFPPLLVKVKRHCSISVKYINENGATVEWNNIDQSTSELLQHEIDHLDGILAVDRAVDKNSLKVKLQ